MAAAADTPAAAAAAAAAAPPAAPAAASAYITVAETLIAYLTAANYSPIPRGGLPAPAGVTVSPDAAAARLKDVSSAVATLRNDLETLSHATEYAVSLPLLLPLLLCLLDGPAPPPPPVPTPTVDDATSSAAAPVPEWSGPAGTGTNAGVAPTMNDAAPEHGVRNAVLELLLRLPVNDVLRPHAARLARALLGVLAADNETNGVVAVKVTTALHKTLKGGLEREATAFLTHLAAAYRALPVVVTHVLNDGTDADAVSAAMHEALAPHAPGAIPLLHVQGAAAAVAARAAAGEFRHRDAPALPADDADAAADLVRAVADRRLLRARHSFHVLQEATAAVVAFATYYTNNVGFPPVLLGAIDAMLRALHLMPLPDVQSLARGALPSIASCPLRISLADLPPAPAGGSTAALAAARLRATRNGDFVALQAKHLWWAVMYARLAGAASLRNYEVLLSRAIVRLVRTPPVM